MYGYPRVKHVDEVRALMLKKMVGDNQIITDNSKVDLARLPPRRRALCQHFKRVNYRVAQWKRSNDPMVDMPSPTEHGCVTVYDDESQTTVLCYPLIFSQQTTKEKKARKMVI